jgi:hypothetical protein
LEQELHKELDSLKRWLIDSLTLWTIIYW